VKLIRIDYNEMDERISIYRLDLHPELIEAFAELGIVEIKDGYIGPADLRRIYKVLRLRRCLGVNLAGASVIVELMEKLEEMDEEIKRLRERQV
jgi:MerR family transcriptional regulator, heat shock protein HspR